MPRKVVLTEDDSATLYSSQYQQHYHSTHGALQESLHVFIRAGLHHPALFFLQEQNTALEVLEMGLGTGLNAALTFADEQWKNKPINYTALEKHPLSAQEWQQLQGSNRVKQASWESLWQQIEQAPWNQNYAFSPKRHLRKLQTDLLLWEPPSETFHLIYYDAFAPTTQPELWTPKVFLKIYRATAPGGILVTYCVKGSVRRALQAAGYTVEKIPGPPGKREMTRAFKPVITTPKPKK